MNARVCGYWGSNYQEALVKFRMLGEVLLHFKVCLNCEIDNFFLVIVQAEILWKGVVNSDTFLEEI